MKLRSPFLIRLIAFIGAIVIRVWMKCVRYRVVSFDSQVHPVDHRRQRIFYAFWHEDILFTLSFKARIRVLISEHADGELIARTAHHLGKGTVRGSTRRGSSRAIMELMRHCGNHHLGITPDGPRGPRRTVQLGLVFLASQTGLPIVPFGVGYSNVWRAKSWDQFAIPLPGSCATCVVAPRIIVPPNLNRAQLESYREYIEQQLRWASDTAERAAIAGRRPVVTRRETINRAVKAAA